MTWIFLLVGVVFGAAYGGIGGALVLGLLGAVAASMMQSRFDRIERRLAEVERELRGRKAPEPAAATAVAAPAPAEAPAFIATPVPAPEPLPTAAVLREEPAAPAQPNFIVAWLAGGNTIVRVGLLILFVGLAFLIKYSVEHQLVPVELRVAGVAATGLVLLVIGWRLRIARPGYALSLQGAGVAILYLTIFGALRLYSLIAPGPAFALLAAIAVLSAFLAVAQDSLALAVVAAAGGFLAPILASTGSGDHVMLFSYYLMLNAGIVAIAWFKAWRVLNLVGFVSTFVIGAAWGFRSYRPDLFGSTQPFLVAFFAIYVAIPILFARKENAARGRYVDGTLVFGVPIAAFGLQAGLMRGTEFGLAYSSLAAAALYLVLATLLQRAARERWKLLGEAFLALGVVFASLAIPLALDARWTSAAWAVEGAAVVWVGVRQKRTLARAFGMLLQLGAGSAFVQAYSKLPEGPPLLDAVFIGALLIAFAGLWTHRLLTRDPDAVTAEEKGVAPLFFLWGLAWWLFAGGHEIHAAIETRYELNAFIAFLAATALGFSWVGAKLGWVEARWPFLVLAPALAILALGSLFGQAHPLQHFGWIAWPFALAVQFGLLRKGEGDHAGIWWQGLHALGALIVALVGAFELEWLASEYTARHSAWSLAARIVAPALVMLAISSRWADRHWPVSAHPAAYRLGAALPLFIAMALWSLHVNATHAGGSEPLPYIPILNALDLAHALAVLAAVAAWSALRRSALEPPAFLRGRSGLAVAGVIVFVWLNAILLRTLHHEFGVAYNLHSMAASVLVQACLSVFWAFLALALMVIATRIGRRALWMVGAGLMAVVVAKLGLMDLSRLGGIERIASFIGVGVLMLVIGYFSPVPPRRGEVHAP